MNCEYSYFIQSNCIVLMHYKYLSLVIALYLFMIVGCWWCNLPGDLAHVSVRRPHDVTMTIITPLTTPRPPELVTRAWASPTLASCPAPKHLWSHLAWGCSKGHSWSSLVTWTNISDHDNMYSTNVLDYLVFSHRVSIVAIVIRVTEADSSVTARFPHLLNKLSHQDAEEREMWVLRVLRQTLGAGLCPVGKAGPISGSFHQLGAWFWTLSSVLEKSKQSPGKYLRETLWKFELFMTLSMFVMTAKFWIEFYNFV